MFSIRAAAPCDRIYPFIAGGRFHASTKILLPMQQRRKTALHSRSKSISHSRSDCGEVAMQSTDRNKHIHAKDIQGSICRSTLNAARCIGFFARQVLPSLHGSPLPRCSLQGTPPFTLRLTSFTALVDGHFWYRTAGSSVKTHLPVTHSSARVILHCTFHIFPQFSGEKESFCGRSNGSSLPLVVDISTVCGWGGKSTSWHPALKWLDRLPGRDRLKSWRSYRTSNIILRDELCRFMRYAEGGCINVDLMEIAQERPCLPDHAMILRLLFLFQISL